MGKEIMECVHKVPHKVILMWVLYERLHVNGGPDDHASSVHFME